MEGTGWGPLGFGGFRCARFNVNSQFFFFFLGGGGGGGGTQAGFVQSYVLCFKRVSQKTWVGVWGFRLPSKLSTLKPQAAECQASTGAKISFNQEPRV